MGNTVYDVLVIGGGPAGTTAATLLAQRGHRVCLVEQDKHPRFHIGESLLPANLPILETLGVLDKVAAIGVHKPGADFTPVDGTVQSFPFDQALGNTPGHAYQVRRSEFDALLFENSRNNGVTVHQACRAEDLSPEPGGYVITVHSAECGAMRLHARFVVDASGRHGLLATRNAWRRKNTRHTSAAIFGHFKGVARRGGDAAGNISVYWFDHGWIWMIPLRDDVMSVGVVCLPDYLRTRRVDLEAFLQQTLAGVNDAGQRMAGAKVIGDISATGNFAYRASRMWGSRYLLLGDAYAFIDPVFSSGVYLAMHSATQAIPAIEAGLNGPTWQYRLAALRFQRRVHKTLAAFSWFIYRFTTPTMRDLFKAPRNDWQVAQAVVSMLAGNGDGDATIRNRLRVFKGIYQAYRLRRIPESARVWRRKRLNQREEFTDENLLS